MVSGEGFSAMADVIGLQLKLNSKLYTITGVANRSFSKVVRSSRNP
jgi:hypothetical protein